MDKRIKVLIEELCNIAGYEKVNEVCCKLRKKMDIGYLKEYWYMYKQCYYYETPITKDTKVMQGVILERYTKVRHGEPFYRFFGEDGRMHDDEDSVMGESKENIERYLNEIRDDMERDGEL